MSVAAEAKPYVEGFAALKRVGEPAWLTQHRAAALARFGELGFPTRRDEAWRYTDLKPLQRSVFTPGPESARATPNLTSLGYSGASHRVVLVNGSFAPKLSRLGDLPKGVWLASSARTLAERPDLIEAALDNTDTIGAQPFAALNVALFADGFVLAIDPGMQLDDTIEIVHWGDAAESAFHLRNLVRLGAGSHATITETYAGRGHYWTNGVTRIELGASAALRHVKIQDEATDAIHFGQVRAELARDARYESFVLTLGGRLSRQDSFVKYAGEDAACGLFGAYLLRGEQEATNATFVDHAVPRCTTKEVFKGVVDEKAHGVFLGKIAVRPEAQKTDAHQLNKNLLLSPRAAVDTKPELEILADDVKCSHGATVGDLDEAALFYLEARGIPAPEARRMLIEAFAADAIDQIEDDAALRAHLAGLVRHWLGRQDQNNV